MAELCHEGISTEPIGSHSMHVYHGQAHGKITPIPIN